MKDFEGGAAVRCARKRRRSQVARGGESRELLTLQRGGAGSPPRSHQRPLGAKGTAGGTRWRNLTDDIFGAGAQNRQ